MRPTDPMPVNPDVTPVNPDVTYEEKDVQTSSIISFGVGLFVVCSLVLVAMWGAFRLFASQEKHNQRALAPGVAASLQRTPAEPRLEPLPLLPRQRLRVAEDALLSSYGWVDRPGGVARIPIDRAMALIVEHGVPGGKPLPPPAAEPSSAPAGAASSMNGAATNGTHP